MTTLASLVSFGSFGLSACGGTPPPTRMAGSASLGESSGGGGAGAASAGSLSDSALGPAARKAALAEDWGDSERLYRELVRRRPGDADARRGLGIALMREGQNIQAVVALNESLELRDALETRLALAENYGEMDRYPSALPHLRRAVALDPQGVDGWVALTHALVKVEKADGAVEVLDESGRVCRACRSDAGWLRGKDEVARALLARAEKQMGAGDVKGANRSLDAAASLNPALPETHLGRAKIARTQGDDTRAASEFRQAVDSLPATAEPGASARLELARLLTYRGEGAEATRLARQVVDARGENLASLDVLGRACDANKDADCARKAYGRLMSLPLASSEPSGGADGGDGGPSVARKAVDHARARLKALKKGGRRRR
jgi:Tfp pilus assembly protein PilF